MREVSRRRRHISSCSVMLSVHVPIYFLRVPKRWFTNATFMSIHKFGKVDACRTLKKKKKIKVFNRMIFSVIFISLIVLPCFVSRTNPQPQPASSPVIEWLSCFHHKLNHINGAKDWLIPNKTFEMSMPTCRAQSDSLQENPMLVVLKQYRAFHW